MNLLKIFGSFLTIGVLAFGGGYAVLPLLERVIIQDNQWLLMSEFVDMIAISQITPGPIIINSATFIGYQITGTVYGAAISTTSVIALPSLIVGTAAYHSTRFKNSKIFQRILFGLRPALVGLIFASVFMISKTAVIDWTGFVLIPVYILLLVKYKWHPLIIVLLSGLLGIFMYSII